MESHSENTRSVTCYQILRKDDSYINHLESWVPTHSSINTDQSEMLPSNFQWQLHSNLWWLRALQQSGFYACGDHEDGGHVTCLDQSEVNAQANQRPQPLSSGSSKKISKANGAFSIEYLFPLKQISIFLCVF